MKKILTIIGGIVVGIVILVIVIFVFVSKTSYKLVCTSPEGNITIMYNDDTLTGYTASGGASYDYDGQKGYADSVGTAAYINEFEAWFVGNTSGGCQRK